jgi:hypothetical protein
MENLRVTRNRNTAWPAARPDFELARRRPRQMSRTFRIWLAFCFEICQQHRPIKFGQDPYVL